MIIDAHAHISETAYGNTEMYLEQLDRAGIDQGIVVPGGMMDVRRMTDYITGRASPESTIPNNPYVTKSCKAYKKRLKGMICIDPHAENALETLAKSYNEGFLGLKFSPMTHQFSFASKAVTSLVDLCQDFGFPVYTHVLYNPGASTARFVALAQQFPKVNFILGHMGFGPADQEGLEAAVKMDNFYLESSTGNFLHMRETIRKAGASKLIFGSEFPLSHPKAELEKILLLDLPDGDLEKVLGGNISELLHLEEKVH